MKVKFVPQNIELEIAAGQSVLDLAQKNGVFIKSICNGLPSCAECRVRVLEGEANLLPPGAKELGLIGTGYFIDQRRLSCQMRCFGDVTVDLNEQVAKQNEGPKRPQGSKKTEAEASSAVSGNLIEQDATIKELASAPSQNDRPQQQGQRQPNNNRERSGGQQGRQNNRQGQGHGQGQGQGQRRDRNPRRS